MKARWPRLRERKPPWRGQAGKKGPAELRLAPMLEPGAQDRHRADISAPEAHAAREREFRYLQKEARQLCYREGLAWSLQDFENSVPGVTMLTVVANDRKRPEFKPCEVFAQTHSKPALNAQASRPTRRPVPKNPRDGLVGFIYSSMSGLRSSFKPCPRLLLHVGNEALRGSGAGGHDAERVASRNEKVTHTCPTELCHCRICTCERVHL